jgi:hypothetical protein
MKPLCRFIAAILAFAVAAFASPSPPPPAVPIPRIDGAWMHVYHPNGDDAPELFQDEDGGWWISSAERPHRGVSIAPVKWETPAPRDAR